MGLVEKTSILRPTQSFSLSTFLSKKKAAPLVAGLDRLKPTPDFKAEMSAVDLTIYKGLKTDFNTAITEISYAEAMEFLKFAVRHGLEEYIGIASKILSHNYSETIKKKNQTILIAKMISHGYKNSAVRLRDLSQFLSRRHDPEASAYTSLAFSSYQKHLKAEKNLASYPNKQDEGSHNYLNLFLQSVWRRFANTSVPVSKPSSA